MLEVRDVLCGIPHLTVCIVQLRGNEGSSDCTDHQIIKWYGRNKIDMALKCICTHVLLMTNSYMMCCSHRQTDRQTWQVIIKHSRPSICCQRVIVGQSTTSRSPQHRRCRGRKIILVSLARNLLLDPCLPHSPQRTLCKTPASYSASSLISCSCIGQQNIQYMYGPTADYYKQYISRKTTQG